LHAGSYNNNNNIGSNLKHVFTQEVHCIKWLS